MRSIFVVLIVTYHACAYLIIVSLDPRPHFLEEWELVKEAK